MLVYDFAHGMITWHSQVYMCLFMRLLLIALEVD